MDKYFSVIFLWFGGLIIMIGVLFLNEWVMVVGIVCMMGIFIVNWYYK